MPSLGFVDACLFDIEADDRDAVGEFDGKRQTNIAEADDADAYGSGVQFQAHSCLRILSVSIRHATAIALVERAGPKDAAPRPLATAGWFGV